MLFRKTATSLLGFMLLAYGTILSAQQAAAPVASSAPSADLAGIAHVAIRVKDLDASVAFYEKLGFVRAFALSREGKVYEAFIKINDHQFLELYPADEKNPQIGFLHVCFYGNDLQSVHDYYVAHGLTPNAVRTAGAGNLLFTMPGPATPTGPQNMEYTQYMPASMHSKAIGQFLGPDRIATHLIEVAIAFDEPGAASAFYRDKVGFRPKQAGPVPEPGFPTLFALPGNPAESIRIESGADLGLRARITLAADPASAAKTLTQRGVPFTKSARYGTRDLVVTDPDGNEIFLRAK
jgi:catechol 2,3-dioxygenase-like lactoylglutathione lyase family enzyme